jgi:peptide deformylase
MIYPIVAYGDPVLRRKAANIEHGTDVQNLVAGMFATMDQADGSGLAAPQIGESIRLFVADVGLSVKGSKKTDKHRQVYINPILRLDSTEVLDYQEEGCLSIPDVMISVPRRKQLIVDYFDINWQPKQEAVEGFLARVVQHEYDHLEGKLHIDYAGPLKRRLLNRKLNDISQGKITVHYSMRFHNNK